MLLTIDRDLLLLETPDGVQEVSIYSPRGFRLLSDLWVKSGWQRKIFYELTWLGIPILQLAEDLLVMQELIWKLRPDVIVETGTAEGGGALFYASILEFLGKGTVLTIDTVVRDHNPEALARSNRIRFLQGSSTDDAVVAEVRRWIEPGHTVLVTLDSDHTFLHVRREMELYSPLVTPGSYLVVFDGVMEALADAPSGSPAWATDNPAAAIRDFLVQHDAFEVDPHPNRLGATYGPGGFLRRKTR